MRYASRRRLLGFPGVGAFRGLLKGVRFRKLGDHSLYDVVGNVVASMKRHEIVDRANAVAFNLILATFPAVIFLFTLIPYISKLFPKINQDSILEFLSIVLPPTMVAEVTDTVRDIVMIQREGLLTFGFLVALFLATNGMMALIRAFNACYKTIEQREIWRLRLTATTLTLLLSFVLLLTITLMIIGELALDYVGANLKDFRHFHVDEVTLLLFNLLRFGVVFLGFLLAISSIYYFGPSVHYNWKFFSWGSWIATLLSMLLSYGFSSYVSRFGSYNKLYGSIGVLIALMVWIQMLTFVLLAGYEINATLHQFANRRHRES